MTIDLLTLFPAMAQAVMAESILGRAQRAGLVKIRVHQLRDYARDRHKTVDDRPFGGGPGMVMKAEPLVDAIEHLRGEGADRAHVIYLTPEGKKLTQVQVRTLASHHKKLLLVSGHYEGIDERVREGWIDEEISVGDYILSNGTLPALNLVDALVRLIPGVLGNE
ncbi:MAG: tRNA (guanine-)-methyltransferase, partial [Verrucomicrobiota bacterium]